MLPNCTSMAYTDCMYWCTYFFLETLRFCYISRMNIATSQSDQIPENLQEFFFDSAKAGETSYREINSLQTKIFPGASCSHLHGLIERFSSHTAQITVIIVQNQKEKEPGPSQRRHQFLIATFAKHGGSPNTPTGGNKSANGQKNQDKTIAVGWGYGCACKGCDW